MLWFNGPNSNVFYFDGAVPIDNNVSEREMNRVAKSRELVD
jgi:hypothetical protein